MSDNQFEGYTYTPKYLNVHFRKSYGGSVRFETVKIPWDQMCRDLEFIEALNNRVADLMRRTWDMGQEEYSLF